MAGTVYVDNIITDTGTTVNVSNVQFTTSGQIRSVAGSASTPGISVQNNTNTGIFFPAANTIAFAEGGVESLRITSEGTLSTNTAGAVGIQLYQDANDPTASSRLFFTSNTASSVLLQSAANLAFLTGATLGSTSGIRRIDFNAFGITLGGSGAASSGMGIKFPAAQSASSDPNSLDDYEEGSWTPTFGGSTSDPTGVVYGSQDGKYTKIGNLVNLNFYLSFTTYTGGSGAIYIKGVPFGASSNGDGALKIENVTLSAGRTYATVTAGGSFIYPNQVGSATTWITMTIGTAVTSSGTTKYFTGSITYMV